MFHLFGPSKNFCVIQSFQVMKGTVSKWQESQTNDFYAEGIQKFFFHSEKVLEMEIILKNKAKFFGGKCESLSAPAAIKLFYCFLSHAHS